MVARLAESSITSVDRSFSNMECVTRQIPTSPAGVALISREPAMVCDLTVPPGKEYQSRKG